MYTFIRAIAVKHGYNQRWTEVDISAIPTNALFSKYREMYAVLSQPTILEPMTLKLNTIADKLQSYTGTISDYLSSIGDAALPTTPGVPIITRHNAVFSDAVQADYEIEPVDKNLGEGVIVPEEDRPDLSIKRTIQNTPLDYLRFRKKVLANVNGFYHRTSASSRGFYVNDGNKTARQSSQNNVGLLSFGTFGDLTFMDIEDGNIFVNLKRESTDVETIYLKYDKDAFKGKTPILIMGGYMVLVDGDTLRSNIDGVLTISTLKYPMIERYFESKKYLDYSDFPIGRLESDPSWTLVTTLKTEAFYRKLLTMPQSFIVLVDTEHLVIEKIYPEEQKVPHTYMCYERPKWPLVACEGKHEVYWSQYEDKSWVLTCGDTYKRHYLYQTSPSGAVVAIDDSLVLADAGRYSPAHFLKLIDEEVEIKT